MVLGVEKIAARQAFMPTQEKEKKTSTKKYQPTAHAQMHPFNKLHDKKTLVLTDNYGDLITFIAQKLEEPITKQYLQTCPKNATYISNTAVESMVDTMNFYFESKSLTEINKSNLIKLYAHEQENSSHKECFAMFVTYYSNKAQKIVTNFLGILHLKGKTAAEIMDVIKNFFWQNL